ncbi:MAG: biotin/lipoyl-binding protein, partial [Anaerolineae bacterium]|nr:biotin/lipoyl-binding protein [Anaerolineae bacterium]
MSIPNDLSMRRPPKKRRWYIITLLVAVISAGLYYQFAYLPGQTSALQDEEPSMQSAVVRRGDLVIRATGSGELIATTQLDVGFDVNARVESINVSVGDRVEDGQVLAALDDSQLQADWQDAQRKYTEFTSPLAVLEAQQNIFDLEESIRISRNYLAYLISPEVLYWEERLEESLETLEAAQLATQETGSDEANQAVADLNKTISFQEANLHATYEDYLDIYVPETFTEEECEGEGRDRVCVDVIKPPGETTIRVARNELSVNQEKLVEAQHYLVAITEERIPEGATGG